MRTITIALALLSMTALSGSRAEATEYPFCMTAMEGRGAYIERCDYATWEQCQMMAPSMNGTCSTNWRLSLTRPGPQPRPVKRRGS